MRLGRNFCAKSTAQIQPTICQGHAGVLTRVGGGEFSASLSTQSKGDSTEEEDVHDRLYSPVWMCYYMC